MHQRQMEYISFNHKSNNTPDSGMAVWGGEKAKSKSEDCCVTFKPKNYVEILLSAHARTLQADILHLDQKAMKCTTCKPVCGKF